jgi:hypothetical protein
MTKLLLTLSTLLVSVAATAQAIVQPAYVDIDKQKRQGYAASTDLDRRFVEKAWKDKLSEYGRVDSKRDVYTVNFAKLPFLDEQARIVSQLNTTKGRTQIFLSVDQNNNEFIAAGHGQGPQVEKLLLDFMQQMDYESQVRAAEKAFEDAESANKDATRKGERLVRDIEANRKEKEKLLKRLDDNKTELIKLRGDSVQNYRDRQAAAQVFEKQRQNLEAVKARKPN